MVPAGLGHRVSVVSPTPLKTAKLILSDFPFYAPIGATFAGHSTPVLPMIRFAARGQGQLKRRRMSVPRLFKGACARPDGSY